jgi:hypothetical protein
VQKVVSMKAGIGPPHLRSIQRASLERLPVDSCTVSKWLFDRTQSCGPKINLLPTASISLPHTPDRQAAASAPQCFKAALALGLPWLVIFILQSSKCLHHQLPSKPRMQKKATTEPSAWDCHEVLWAIPAMA